MQPVKKEFFVAVLPSHFLFIAAWMRSHLCSAVLSVFCSREQALPQRILYFGLRANTEKKKEETFCPFTDGGPQAERDELTCNDHPGNLW